MTTIGECVGGVADGVQLDCEDPSEPDDWPDVFKIEAKAGGKSWYERRSEKPVLVKGQRVYYFDAINLAGASAFADEIQRLLEEDA